MSNRDHQAYRGRSFWQLLTRVCFMVMMFVVAAGTANADHEIFSSGFESGSLGEWDPPTVFRFTDFDLRDPHVFIDLSPLGCPDITDNGGLVPAINELIEDGITMDSEPDGLLDLNFLLQFRPLDPAGTGLRVDQRSGLCTAPLAGTSCTHDPDVDAEVFFYDTVGAGGGVCLEPIAMTTTGYLPAIATPAGPCFSTLEGDLTVGFLGIAFALERARLAAAFDGGMPGGLSDGLAMGFLSEAAADAVLFPVDTPFVGGEPLSSVLPGGTGNCHSGDDIDMLDSTPGWWFYFNFTATEIPYAGY